MIQGIINYHRKKLRREIANALDFWRRHNNVSRRQLADASGMPLSSINHIEKGNRGVGSRVAKKLDAGIAEIERQRKAGAA